MRNQIHHCKEMKAQLEMRCDLHIDSFECADRLVIYNSRFDEYGLIIHDGGTSYSVIQYCPWCGEKLPDSKRDRWFETLKARGFDNPTKQEIPSEFLTDQWYRKPAKRAGRRR
jgi:Domain of unknown function (DUF6980)